MKADSTGNSADLVQCVAASRIGVTHALWLGVRRWFRSPSRPFGGGRWQYRRRSSDVSTLYVNVLISTGRVVGVLWRAMLCCTCSAKSRAWGVVPGCSEPRTSIAVTIVRVVTGTTGGGVRYPGITPRLDPWGVS